jgi:hypothetical protein
MHPRHIGALVPSGLKILACSFVSIVLLGIYNWGIILDRYIRGFFIDQAIPEYKVHYQITRYIDNNISKNVTLALVWSLVGVGVYTIIWGAINTAISARNAYVIKQEFANQASIYDTIEHHLARSSLLLGSVGLLLICVKYVLPWCFHQSSTALLEPTNIIAVGGAVAGFVSMVLIFHVISVLVAALFAQEE